MDNYLLISDAAKEVKVESHVLRYWEEELHLPIKRNELGHRYYTEEDVERFKQIKGMKERGLQLKAIKMILKDGKLDVLSEDGEARGAMPLKKQAIPAEMSQEADIDEETGGLAIDIIPEKNKREGMLQETKEDKFRRLQWLLQQLIRQTLQENNGELCREIRESVVKELDYQFRMQEEREEARDRMLAERDEEHYKKMDELLRRKSHRLRRDRAEKDTADAQEKNAEKISGETRNGERKNPEKKRKRFF